jgi:hypothetical protein
MTLRGMARFFACLGLIGGSTAASGCGDCAGIGASYMPPADTTVALHGNIVLAAGTGGSCQGTGPISASALTHWQAVDSSIVSIVVLDSLHARINGLAVGTTAVTASANGFLGSTTQVTVR